MRSSQEARANGMPCPRNQSITSFLSEKFPAAMAAIHRARSRPVRASRSARNSRSSSSSSRAMCEGPSEPAARASLVGKILLAEARLQMPFLGQDGKDEQEERQGRCHDCHPDVAGGL